jgi:hypothetical protein
MFIQSVPVLLLLSKASLEELLLEPVVGLLSLLVVPAALVSHPRQNSLLWPLGHDAPGLACPSEKPKL